MARRMITPPIVGVSSLPRRVSSKAGLPERIRSHEPYWLALSLVRLIETETRTTSERLREELEQIHLVNLCSKDRYRRTERR